MIRIIFLFCISLVIYYGMWTKIIINNFYQVVILSLIGSCQTANLNSPLQKCCPHNEQLYYYDFIEACVKDTCQKAINNFNVQCKMIAPKAKYPYCNCIENTYRNLQQLCVTLDECIAESNGTATMAKSNEDDDQGDSLDLTNKCCPENEVLYAGSDPCYETNCEDKLNNVTVSCSANGSKATDKKTCHCFGSTYRNSQNKCVPLEQC